MNLRLLQLGDSALPIGGYSHSWGLEAAIDRGLVNSPQTLENWTRSWLRDAIAPCEGVVVAAVCKAALAGEWTRVFEANELLWLSITPPTLRNASRDLGEQLLSLGQSWDWCAETLDALLASTDDQEWHHAPVFGTLAAAAKATPREALAVYLHQAALGCIGAGVRAIPIGHTHGQQILTRLHDDLESLSATFADCDLETAGSFSPAYEVLCHEQSNLYTRLFRS